MLAAPGAKRLALAIVLASLGGAAGASGETAQPRQFDLTVVMQGEEPVGFVLDVADDDYAATLNLGPGMRAARGGRTTLDGLDDRATGMTVERLMDKGLKAYVFSASNAHGAYLKINNRWIFLGASIEAAVPGRSNSDAR
ncbi:MAG TPA: hypothetical protein QF861_07770 [Alphaproteobacteria bacterium]|jgi:subtilisin family serine protease|nr:hypothetical protein [Alphaproteobacteria bacterium]